MTLLLIDKMAFILQDSQPAMQLENQLFAMPATFTDRWRTEHEKINPTTVLTEDGTAGDINFYIPPSSSGLLSLNDIYLELEVAIKYKTDKDWLFIDETCGVAPVANLLHSLFQSLHVTLANRLISDAATFYPYRAYLDSLLRCAIGAQESHLSSALFIKDTEGAFNSTTTNYGEKDRKQYFEKGHFVQLSGRLCADICQQTKPLITGVPLNVRLVMSRQQFMLRVWDQDATKQFKVFVRNPRLAVRRYIPAPDFMLAVADQLQHKTVKYHIERTVMRVADIPANTQSTVVSNLQIGQLPKVVVIGFVTSEDFHGSGKTSPFKFEHFNLQQISVEVDGQSYPTKPYTADFEKGMSLECYDGLMDAMGIRNDPIMDTPMTRKRYEQGYTLFGFDLTPGATGLGPLTLVKQGNLSVAVTFAKPLPKTVMMVTMLVYDSVLEINQHRQLIADFTA